MKIQGVGITDLGLRRSNNEDAFWFDDTQGIYIVCDGMGGRAGGEVASAMAIESVSSQLQSSEAEWKELLRASEQKPFRRFINRIINTACRAIYERSQTDLQNSGMGTTLTGVLIEGDQAALFHVGDSRLYLCRGQNGYQLTNDHTLLQEFLNDGLITPEEAQNHPHGHVLTRSLGTRSSVLADTLLFNILPEDVLVLCSDGLSNTLDSNDELAFYTYHEAKDMLPKALIEHANAKGGKDNITAVVVRASFDDAASSEQTEEMPGHPWGLFHQMLFALQESFLCNGFQLRETLRLLNICNRAEVEQKGISIVQEGAIQDRFCIVLDGRCSITQEGRFAREIGPGQFFGLGALIEEQHSLEEVKAIGPVAYLEIRRSDFIHFTQRRSKLGFKLMRNISSELNRSWRLLKEVIAEMTPMEPISVHDTLVESLHTQLPILGVDSVPTEQVEDTMQTEDISMKTEEMSMEEVLSLRAEEETE